MRRAVRRTLWIAVAVASVAGAIAIGDLVRDRREDARVEREAAEIATLIHLPGSGHSQTFDAVRAFIYANTVGNMNSEFWKLNRERAFTSAILAHVKGRRAEPVPMECASRSNLMGAVLRALGYETRRVALFDTDTKNLQGHTFLEVLNPETGQWESQDPLYDLYWRDNTTGARVSVFEHAEMIFDDLEPCSEDGCGWTRKSSKLRPLIDVLTLADKEAGTKRSIYTSRANPAGPFTVKGRVGSFCEVMAKRCGDGFAPAKQ
jgi:hypothetical protein